MNTILLIILVIAVGGIWLLLKIIEKDLKNLEVDIKRFEMDK